MAVKYLIVLAALAQLSDATANIRGHAVSLEANLGIHSVKKAPVNWRKAAMGGGIGALVAGVIVGGVLFMKKKGEGDAKEVEGDEAVNDIAEPLLPAAAVKKTDYAELLSGLTKRVTEEVGPKFSKGGSVRNLLEKRMTNFQDKAKNFMLNEMNGTASAVMNELEAEESLLTLEWNQAVEANFPAPSILIAGVLSPTIVNIMSFHHFVQVITVGLPLFCLCIWAVYEDWGEPCSAIPTLYGWLYTTTFLAFLLFMGHGMLCMKLRAGKKSIQAKREEVDENLKGTEEGGFSNLKEQFIGKTIILQEALQIENSIRHSSLNMVVGLASVGWLITTVWNLVLITGWTFVPGVVAFHPDAAGHKEYCGAWATVLVLKISMLLSVLYLFVNLATVMQWLCDMMIASKGFGDTVTKEAQKIDKNGAGGLPVAEILTKALLLRGGDESVISRLAVVQHHRRSLQSKKADVESKLTALQWKIESQTEEEEALKVKAEGGGDLAAQVHKLSSDSVDYELWKKQGSMAIEEADQEAHKQEYTAAKTEALDILYEQISQTIEDVKNSDTVKAAIAAALEAEAAIEAKVNQARDMLNDPEFQAKVREYAEAAKAQCEALGEEAKALADQAVAAAKDPEFQKKLQDMANEAMKEAQAVADKVADAAEHSEEMQAMLKETMEKAQAAAKEAAAGITDPALQKKMEETARQALQQVQQGAEAATQALLDPETQKRMQESALAAMADARAAADSAIAAATDPKVRAEAMAKLKEAQEAAEKAALIATDPYTKKKFEEAAASAMAKAQELGAEGAEKVSAAAKEGAEKASAAAKEVGEKAEKAVKEVQSKASKKKGNK